MWLWTRRRRLFEFIGLVLHLSGNLGHVTRRRRGSISAVDEDQAMMDTLDYRSTPATHQLIVDQHVYHTHHQQHQQRHQQAASVVAASRMLQSPSPTDTSTIDTSYATLQPLPSHDKYSATSTAGLLASPGPGGFPGFMEDMSINPYAAYKYDKLNGMQENCSAAFGGGSSYGMIHNGYGGHHQPSLASLYHHPGTASAGYVSPNGFQLSHHKSLLDTKPPAPQMISPGPSPTVAAYDPYSRSGLLSVAAAGPPAAPTGAGGAPLLLPAASSPLSAAYSGHHMFPHHQGSPAMSPSTRALHHSLTTAGPHRSLHELRCGGPVGAGPTSGSSTAGAGHCHEMEEINTRELAQKISSELKRYSIPQAVFAQRVLCRSQGTLSDLLRNPKPWSKLKSGRETFRRMWKWLQEPEYQRMSALRLAGKLNTVCPINPLKGRDVNWLHFAIQV